MAAQFRRSRFLESVEATRRFDGSVSPVGRQQRTGVRRVQPAVDEWKI